MASNTIKTEIKEKFKNLLGINFVKYLSIFLASIKKHLGDTGIPTNVQNNCIKLSGFGLEITKLFLHREITRNISCRETSFDPKFVSEAFRTYSTISAVLFRAKQDW